MIKGIALPKGSETLLTQGKSTKKEPKKTYGEFNNVRLTDTELDKLKERFTDYKDRIEALSSYKSSKGKSYKNDYSTILTWERRERSENKSSKASPGASQFAELDKALFGTSTYGDW